MIEDGQVENMYLSVRCRSSMGVGRTRIVLLHEERHNTLSKDWGFIEDGHVRRKRTDRHGQGILLRHMFRCEYARVRGACSKICVNATTPSASATDATCSPKRAADADERTVGALARIVLVTWLTEQGYLQAEAQ
jgi:hypothetical protein